VILVLPYPYIDPVALKLGLLSIRWYSLAYITGLVLGWRYCLALVKWPPAGIASEKIDDFMVWATLAVILGGRLGYTLFYKPEFYFSNPEEIFLVWKGGMSFHGGFLGLIVSIALFCRRHTIPFLRLGDLVCAAAPIGLFFGRLSNFINGELYGRVADVSWAVVFPRGGPYPRHPSQLYEATLEGPVLLVLLYALIRGIGALERPGLVSGVFAVGYSLSRIAVEFFRQPDAHLGYLFAGATMGQLLSLPILLFGLWLILNALWKDNTAPPKRKLDRKAGN
jgi:phosphatidylglycerol:prolipoprotein diacylglycerol transferase